MIGRFESVRREIFKSQGKKKKKNKTPRLETQDNPRSRVWPCSNLISLGMVDRDVGPYRVHYVMLFLDSHELLAFFAYFTLT